MKKNLLFFLIFCSSFLQAQNLVPNYSFEQYLQCPDNENEISYSIGWKSYYATPDYYNVCATNPWVSIPNNLGGSYQPTTTGNAYCGFYAYWSPTFSGGLPNLREYIGRQLASPLVVGQKYFVSFKVSLAFNNNSASCATNNLGIKFSTIPYDLYADSSGSSILANNIAHIYDTTLISDTVNWTTIRGSFIADSTYNYLIIGNFFKDVNTDTLILSNSYIWCYSYYYVEDICVSTDSLTCDGASVNEIQLQNVVKIYPNPFSASTTIKLNDGFCINNCYVKLYDMVGEELRNYKMKNNELQIERDGLTNGIYFLHIQFGNYKIIQKLIITN